MTPSHEDLLASQTAAAVMRNRRLALGACVFFLVDAAIVAQLGLGVGRGFALWVVTLIAAGALVSLYAGASAIRTLRLRRAPLLRVLREDPGSVVWVFVMHHRRVGSSFRKTVHIRCAPRNTFVLHSLSAEAIVAELARWCPHAHLGWSSAIEQKWSADPMSLRAPPPQEDLCSLPAWRVAPDR